jgi:triacylglycerol lipase
MGPFGLVSPATAAPEALPTEEAPGLEVKEATGLQVRFEDSLAAGGRVWVRGRLVGRAEPTNGTTDGKPWWKWWQSREGPPPALPPLHLETRIGGTTRATEVPLGTDGRFEAQLAIHLPHSRRGWRVARNRVTVGGDSWEACNVVLSPPAEAAAALIVLLPLEFTRAPEGCHPVRTPTWASRLPELVRRLQPRGGSGNPVYYLACVPPTGLDRQPQLGLAITSLGCPPGHLLLLAEEPAGPAATFAAAIERLRWLFAGTLDLVLVNLEPTATDLPVGLREPAEDWAVVRRLIQLDHEARKHFDNGPPKQGRRRVAGPRPVRAALLPRHPVVFCHGMLAFSMLKMQMPEDANCFAVLRDFLTHRGFRVLFPQVLPTGGVIERAQSLREQILRWTDEPINLIAHSMGGLDARYLITHLGMADRVQTLTTVCTPHRGTYLAEWFLANYRQRVPLLLALEAFGVNVNGFFDCRIEACREFNARTPDHPAVRYFSYGGEVSPARISPVLRRAWNILTPVEGPNDGMVSVASARWGEYLGTVHADHFAQTPDAVFLRPGETFNALEFYSRMVEDLARRGF